MPMAHESAMLEHHWRVVPMPEAGLGHACSEPRCKKHEAAAQAARRGAAHM